MEESTKILCPYCGSDDVYRDNANRLLTFLQNIFGALSRRSIFSKPPEVTASYHCFDCHKDFNKPKIVRG
jgi:DNA-directed RNA polymerase subunit RPC12/RpoP